MALIDQFEVIMKRCPTCNRTFTDPSLSFCIEDGTPLVKADVPPYDAEATIVAASPSQSAREGVPDETGVPHTPAYQAPPIFPPPPPSQKKKIWPWVVGSLAVLVLVFVGLGIAAAVFVPKMMNEAENRNSNRPSFPANTGSNANTNTSANTNAQANSSTLNANDNSNENDAENSPPTDEELVLSDLKNIEDEWTAANLNADRKKLVKILADDYVQTVNGAIQGKADYLRDIKPDPTIQHWEFQNLKLTLTGSRATLTGLVSLESSERNEPIVLQFTDKFVWRDGRWQAVSSEVTPLKESRN